MSTCEKCWLDASRHPDMTEEYRRLIGERAGPLACTPEEQAGPDAKACALCDGRSVLHQHTGECMVDPRHTLPGHGRCRCPDEVVIPFGADHVWTGNLRHSRMQGCYSMPGGSAAGECACGHATAVHGPNGCLLLGGPDGGCGCTRPGSGYQPIPGPGPVGIRQAAAEEAMSTESRNALRLARYVVWVDYGLEGWSPTAFNSAEKVKEWILDGCTGSGFVITSPISIDLEEPASPPAEPRREECPTCGDACPGGVTCDCEDKECPCWLGDPNKCPGGTGK